MLLGCAGGVGSALLAVLQRSEVGRRLLGDFDVLFLADQNPTGLDPELTEGCHVLPAVSVRGPEDVERLIQQHRLTHFVSTRPERNPS